MESAAVSLRRRGVDGDVDDDLIASTAACIPEEPTPSIAPSLTYSNDSRDGEDEDEDEEEEEDEDPIPLPRRRRASTRLVAQNAADVRRITGESSSRVIERCCGGGCCLDPDAPKANVRLEKVALPDNDAFRSLKLRIDALPVVPSGVMDLPEQTVYFEKPVNGEIASESKDDPAVGPDAAGTGTNEERGEEGEEEEEEEESSHDTDGNTNGNTDIAPSMSSSSPSVSFSPSSSSFSVDDALSTLSIASTDTAPSTAAAALDTSVRPPSFVQPHPPYHVFPARIHNVRELTREGAEKRTYHFDLDVSDYPHEEGVDFKVGGAIGVSAPNDPAVVESVLDALMIPRFLRGRPVLLRTAGGRWPTVWGDERPRRLLTTRRDLLTWCSDVQSYAPTKPLLRVLAEHASEPAERRILTYLCSAEGQGAFCDLRTGPHVSFCQLLHAFPSTRPPLERLLSVLQPLMPRFYSLSNDPHESFCGGGDEGSVARADGLQHPLRRVRRIIEVAVTVHETADWRDGCRTGVGSGFFERQALRFLHEQRRQQATGAAAREPEVYIPMFKGLMANPLARQFVTDGPMLLIGAGVGIAPFRGFVQRRLKSANCANKVWVLQGIRDSLLDEIYQGEWGVHEDDVKRVVQSRAGEGRYVQEEVLNQADLVWYIINSVDGRVFVCGSTRGMGEGVEEALVTVAMKKGNLDRDSARKYWDLKKEVGQYIAETW